MSLVRFKQTCFCLRLSCLPSFTPNTKCLLSDVLSMLTGFLPHGGVGRYYLFLRSRYRQFLGIWRIAMTKKGSSISPRCRKGDHSRKSTDEGTAESFELQTNAMPHLARTSKWGQTQTTAINPDQHLWNPQDHRNTWTDDHHSPRRDDGDTSKKWQSPDMLRDA